MLANNRPAKSISDGVTVPFGSVPLVVTIHGRGPCTGKTTLQFLLAQFLADRGHKVHVTDAAVGDSIFKGVLRHYRHPANIIPMPVFLHVATDADVPPMHHLDGLTPKEWQGLPL